MAGDINVYVCTRDSCKSELVTKDIDSGTTPISMVCRVCGSRMNSRMYQVDQGLKPEGVFYRPINTKKLSRPELEYVTNGGLLFKLITGE